MRNYKSYLASEEWGRRRAAALLRAGGKCQLCSSTSALNVHHNTYERLAEEQPEDLVVLCRACHATVHHRMPVRAEEQRGLIWRMLHKDIDHKEIAYTLGVSLFAVRRMAVALGAGTQGAHGGDEYF